MAVRKGSYLMRIRTFLSSFSVVLLLAMPSWAQQGEAADGADSSESKTTDDAGNQAATGNESAQPLANETKDASEPTDATPDEPNDVEATTEAVEPSLGSDEPPEETPADDEPKNEAEEVLASLPPEPPADGVAGAWYQVDVECIDCSDFSKQKILVAAPIEVIRGFNEQFLINPDKGSGTFIEPATGAKTELVVREAKKGGFVLVAYTHGEGQRITDRLARVWHLKMMAGENLFYGRHYHVIGLDESVWKTSDEGYEADRDAVPIDKLVGLAQVSVVTELTREENSFSFGNARIEFVGNWATIRSDYDPEAVVDLQYELASKAEEERRRKITIAKHLKAAKEAMKDEDWASCVISFSQSHMLGYESDETWYYLGKCLEMSGDMKKAAIAYQEVLKIVPRDVVTMFRLAGVYEQLNKPQEAIDLYKRIEKATVRESDDWKDAHYKRLDLFEKMTVANEANNEVDEDEEAEPEEGGS